MFSRNRPHRRCVPRTCLLLLESLAIMLVVAALDGSAATHPSRVTAAVGFVPLPIELGENRGSNAAALDGRAAAHASSAASRNAVFCVTRAVYRAVPQEDRLQITAELELRQSGGGPGWTRRRARIQRGGRPTMSLDLGTMSLESATLDDEPAPLLRNPDGRLLLIGGKRGISKLQLRLTVPLHRIGRDHAAIIRPVAAALDASAAARPSRAAAPDASAAAPTPSAAATLTVDVPANRSLRIDGNAVRRAKPLGEKTEHTLAVGNRSRVELRFTSGAAASGLDSVVLAESRSTLALSAGLADWQCETRFHVSGVPRKTFEASFSGRMQVTGASSPELEDWSVFASKADPSRSAVRITFRRAFTGTRTVRFTGRTALPTEPFWQVPNFVIDGVDSHAGHVAVSFPKSEAIRVDEFAGVRQSSGLPPGSPLSIIPVATGSTQAGSVASARKVLEFDFWKQDFELNLVLPKRRNAGAADVVADFDVHRKTVRMEFAAACDIRETQRRLALSLPAEWSIRTVTVNGLPADWKTLPVEAGVQHLQIAVPAVKGSRSHGRQNVGGRTTFHPRSGERGYDISPKKSPDPFFSPSARLVRLAVTALRDLEYPEKPRAAAVWKIPVVRLPDSRLIRGEIFIRASDNIAVSVADTNQLQPVPGESSRDRYAYRYVLRHKDSGGFGATVAVRPKSPAFSIEALTVAKLNGIALGTQHEIRVTPEAGGFRSLELLLPRHAELRIPIRWKGTSARLIRSQRVSSDRNLDRWKLRFDRTVRETGKLLVELAAPRPNAPGAAVQVHPVRFPDAERTTGYVVILADERQQLTVDAHYAAPHENRISAAKAGPRRAKRPLPLAEVTAGEVMQRFSGREGRGFLPVNGSRSHVRQTVGGRTTFHPRSGERGYDRMVAAYRYVVPNIHVSVTESRLSGDAAVPLICRQRSLRTIVNASGAMQHHVEYDLQGSGVHDVQVHLPQQAELWAAMCNGRPVEVRRAGDWLVLPLAPGWFDPDRRRLELIYHLKAGPLGPTGRIPLTPPTITISTAAPDGCAAAHPSRAAAHGSGSQRPLIIRRSGWILYYPPDIHLTDADGQFRAVQPFDEPGWLKRPLAWTAARRLTLLCLLLAVPFLWIAVRFLQMVVHNRNSAPSWQHVAGFLMAAGILIAVILSGRGHWSTDDAAALDGRAAAHASSAAAVRNRRGRPTLPNFATASPSPDDSRHITVQQPVLATIDVGGIEESGRQPLGRSTEGGKSSAVVGRGARFSVPVQFEPSDALAVKRFEYLGTADGPAGLELTYESRGHGFALRLCVLAAMLIVCGLLRRRSGRFRGTLAVLGLALPPAVAMWTPADWQPFVDGVFIGTLIGVAVFGLRAAIAGAKRLGSTGNVRDAGSVPHGVRDAARVLARVFPLSALLFAGGNAFAEDASPVPPVGFVSAANYEIAIVPSSADAPGSAAVTARFDVVSLQAESASVALPLGRVAVRSATLNGKPAVVNWRTKVVAAPDGRAAAHASSAAGGKAPDAVGYVVVPTSGRHILQMSFSLPLRTGDGETRFVLPVRPVASGKAIFTLPSKQLQARFRGLIGAYLRTIHNGKPVVEFPVDNSRDIAIQLRDAAKPPSPAASVVVESAQTRVDVKDSGIFQRDELTLRVANGGIDTGTFSVPADFRVIGISGSDVAGWELSPPPWMRARRRIHPGPPQSENRTIRIDFRRRITKTTTVVLNLFRGEQFAEESTTVALNPVRAHSAAALDGSAAAHASSAAARVRTVSVFAGPEFVIREANGNAAKPIASRTRIRGESPRLAWRLQTPGMPIGLQISRRVPQTAATARHAVLIAANDVRITSRLSFDFLGSPRTRLSLLLPEGYTLNSLRASHGGEWSHGAEETSAIVVFPKPQSGTVRVVLDGVLHRRTASSTLKLILPGPTAAGRLDVSAGVWNAAGLTARLNAADGWTPLEDDAIPAAIRARHPQRPVSVLRTNNPEPNPIVWDVAQPVSNVRASTLTLIRVTDTAVHYTLLLKWSGVAGVRRSVAFSVPNWIGRKLDFRLNRHLRIEPQFSQHAGSERMRWIVTDFDAASREVVVVATATLPPPLARGNRVAAPKPDVFQRVKSANGADAQSAEYAAVQRSRHFVVLINESGDRLERATVPKFPRFATTDLPQRLQLSDKLRRGISRAAERLRTDGSPGVPLWMLKPALPGSRSNAVVNRAELTTLLERDGSWRMRAVYRMTNDSRGHLAVKLPANSRLLAAEVAGRPVHTSVLRKANSEFRLVPLPKHPHRWNGLSVRLLVVGRLPEGSFRPAGVRSLLGGSVTLSLPAPRVVSRNDDADLGIPVQETLWTVHLADGLTASVVATNGNFRGPISTERTPRMNRGRRRNRRRRIPPPRGMRARRRVHPGPPRPALLSKRPASCTG